MYNPETTNNLMGLQINCQWKWDARWKIYRSTAMVICEIPNRSNQSPTSLLPQKCLLSARKNLLTLLRWCSRRGCWGWKRTPKTFDLVKIQAKSVEFWVNVWKPWQNCCMCFDFTKMPSKSKVQTFFFCFF